MRMFLAVVIFSAPVFGQAAYSGHGSYSGAALYFSSNCTAPNYCAYNGVDVIPAGIPPNLSNSDGTDNGTTVYDTTFLGHTNFDGSIFSNSSYLSPVTRLTDVNSSHEHCNTYAAGQGGSGSGTLVNTNTSLVGIVCNGSEFVGLFNASGAHKGRFTPINSGVLITQDLCTGVGCTVGSSASTQDFGTIVFSYTDPSTLFTFGTNTTDISTPTTVCPYSINTATGAYSLLNCIVDFKYGLPQWSAPNWSASTNYSFGNYIIHPLSTAELATSGVWTAGHTYSAGDIVVAQGGSTACAYVAQTAAGSNTTGSSPPFINSSPCKSTSLTDATVSGGGNKWRGINSTAQFVFQQTNPACTVSAPCIFGIVVHNQRTSGHALHGCRRFEHMDKCRPSLHSRDGKCLLDEQSEHVQRRDLQRQRNPLSLALCHGHVHEYLRL